MEMHLTTIDFNKTVSEIVRNDYRTADVFKKFGINYCCGGQMPLQEACAHKNIELDLLQNELHKATRVISLPNNLRFNKWRLDFLIDYIVNVHHEYLKQTLPSLDSNLLSFIEGHKKKYPYLVEVLITFQELSATLINHNQQEEGSIFPYIKQIESTYRRKEVYGSLFIRTMRKSLESIIKEDHKQISELLLQLRQQTNNYQFNDKACTNHQVMYHKLRELDNDLTQHLHLENNIIYPKAIEMEQELLHSNVY